MEQRPRPWLTVVGVGPGDAAYLTPACLAAAAEAEVLVGGRRALALFADLEREKIVIGGDLEALAARLHALRGRRVAVLVSGDPGLYSLLSWLRGRFPPEEIKVVPGISSVQLAFARLGLPWQEARIISVHGRSWEELAPYLPALRLGRPPLLAVLTGGENTPSALARYLLAKGVRGLKLWVGWELGCPGERVLWATLEELAARETPAAAVVVLGADGNGEDKAEAGEAWPFVTPGLPDDLFCRNNVPMTKEEIRVLTLAKARLAPGQTLWDVGAGTGSLAVEAARLVFPGQVFAVERDEAALALLAANRRRWQVANMEIVPGEAPGALAGLPAPDRVLVGGSGGKLGAILEAAALRLQPGGIVVVNAVTHETLSNALSFFEEQGWETEAVTVQVTKLVPAGGHHLWRANNPVTIIRAQRERVPRGA